MSRSMKLGYRVEGAGNRGKPQDGGIGSGGRGEDSGARGTGPAGDGSTAVVRRLGGVSCAGGARDRVRHGNRTAVSVDAPEGEKDGIRLHGDSAGELRADAVSAWGRAHVLVAQKKYYAVGVREAGVTGYGLRDRQRFRPRHGLELFEHGGEHFAYFAGEGFRGGDLIRGGEGEFTGQSQLSLQLKIRSLGDAQEMTVLLPGEAPVSLCDVAGD